MKKTLVVGFAMTGSFCTLESVFPVIKDLLDRGIKIMPIISENCASLDTRYGKAAEFLQKIQELTNNELICTINSVELIGPKGGLDILVIAPCTGNTLAKLACGITDTCVSMAAKAQLRNERPVVLSISTNDALKANAKNIGQLLNTKNVYFVPFRQDDPINKPASLVSAVNLIYSTLKHALRGKQIQPLML